MQVSGQGCEPHDRLLSSKTFNLLPPDNGVGKRHDATDLCEGEPH